MKPKLLDPGDATLERLLNWLPTLLTALVLVGAFVMTRPAMVPGGPPLSAIDALFTMTAAVTCTGLSVRDPAIGFSALGQSALIIFVWLGCILYMIGGAAIAFRLRDRLDPIQRRSVPALPRLILGVVTTAVAIQLVAAVLMLPCWDVPEYLSGGEQWSQRMGWSVFHAISAFCNSGWGLERGNLQAYRHSLLTHGLIAPLIVLGGLGYPVLLELGQWITGVIKGIVRGAKSVAGVPPLSRYSKLVIGMTAGLYLCGVLGILAGQLKPQLDPLLNRQTENRVPPPPLTAQSLGAHLADASFTSISARSTGFQVIPLDDSSGGPDFLRPAGRFLLMPLMLIGGAPGGAAGGMSVVAAGILLAALAAALAGKPQTTLFNAAIEPGLIRFAATAAVCWLLLATVTTFLLGLSEPFPISSLLFTSASAAGNAGVSLGSVELASFTPFGKAIVAGAMLLGRIGGLVVVGEMILPPNVSPPARS